MELAFRGESQHKVDQKGRVSIPSDFRQIVAQGDPDCAPGSLPNFTIVYGDSRLQCLKCYTEQAIRQIDAEISELPRSSPERRYLQHFYQTRSVRVGLDPTGRLVLGTVLKEKLAFDDQVWFAGTGDSFEIWGSEAYSKHRSELESMFRDGESVQDPMSLIESAY